MNVKINLTFTIINLFLLPCTSDDYVISVQIGTGKRNLFIAFAITLKKYKTDDLLYYVLYQVFLLYVLFCYAYIHNHEFRHLGKR